MRLGPGALALVVAVAAIMPMSTRSAPLKADSSSSDPVAVSDCALDNGNVTVTIGNRTRHDLLNVVLHLVDLNHDGKAIGGLEVGYSPTPSLAGGQSAIYSMPATEITLFDGTAADVSQQSCAIESAVLSGNNFWKAGQPWPDALVDVASPSGPPPVAQAPAAPAPPFTVLSVWTTAGQNVTYLHVRVNLHPAFSATTQASDFRVVTSSPTGGSETEYGINQPAPTYLKANRVGNFLSALNNQAQATPVPVSAVDASEDLGRQGRVAVTAGDPMTEVVTFMVRPDTDVDQGHVTKALSWLAAPSSDDTQQPDTALGPPALPLTSTPGFSPNPMMTVNLPNGRHWTLEVFNSDMARSIGLSGRSFLGVGSGGIFPIAMLDQRITMWMKNTPFSLDFIFVNCDSTISSIATEPGAQPWMSDMQIPRAVGFGCWVVAVPGNTAVVNGVRVGMHLPNLPRYAP